MKYTTRPLSDRTWLRPGSQRVGSPFSASWANTLALLGREIEHLCGRNVVIEVDVREQDIRLDGMLRANARAETPAVVVAFETRHHGPMLYRCDRFVSKWHDQGPDWQQNVRAIALTLEALRAADRYGATETGQQYAGFKALPAGPSETAPQITRDEAIAVLAELVDPALRFVGMGRDDLRSVYRRARAAAHPDRHGGDRTLWDQVEQAARVLGVAS